MLKSVRVLIFAAIGLSVFGLAWGSCPEGDLDDNCQVDFEDVRDYANKQLVQMGIKTPDNPKEERWFAEAQQAGDKPDPAMLLAMAEDKKAQAALLGEQVNIEELKLDAQNEAAKRQIDVFNAQTKRLDTQIKAQQADATIDFQRSDAVRKSVETKAKVISSLRPTSK